MARAPERPSHRGWRGAGTARSALALGMAAVTGCYHTASVTRVPHDRVKQVERVPDGTQLQLRALEVEPGVLALTAEELPMCRDLEQGTRSWSIQTIEAKHFLGMDPGGVRGPSAPAARSEDAGTNGREDAGTNGREGAGTNGSEAPGTNWSEDPGTKRRAASLARTSTDVVVTGICLLTLPICLAFGMVIMAVGLVAIPIWFLLPDKVVTEEPSRERPVPYREWRSEQVSCGQPPRVLSDMPLRILARLNQTQCLEWRTVTAADGSPSLLPPLERTQALVVPCDQPVATGCVWMEPVGDVVEPPEMPEHAEPSVAHRTLGALVRTLAPVEAEALGLAGPPPGKVCRSSVGASPAPSEDVSAVQACRSTQAPECRSRLDACLAGPDSFCWSSALRCQPRAPEFTSCMVANMMPYEDGPTRQGR